MHDSMPRVLFEVVERTSNKRAYSVWIKRRDGKPFETARTELTRADKKEFLLEQAHSRVFTRTSHWHHIPF